MTTNPLSLSASRLIYVGSVVHSESRNIFPLTQSSMREQTFVEISEAGKASLSAERGRSTKLSSLEISPETSELLKSYDFHDITPNQLTWLGVELFRRGEINQDAANSFLNVEMNTIAEMDPNRPIDVVAHFERMLTAAQRVVAAGETSEFAVYYREQATEALSKLMKMSSQNQ